MPFRIKGELFLGAQIGDHAVKLFEVFLHGGANAICFVLGAKTFKFTNRLLLAFDVDAQLDDFFVPEDLIFVHNVEEVAYKGDLTKIGANVHIFLR